MDERFLSSAQTFLMKFVFPTLWIGGFGAGTVAMWLGTLPSRGGTPPSEWMKWEFLGAWCAGTALIIWICGRLKRVRLVGDVLYVSNYRREIAIPVGLIDRVSENRWINIHPVTLHFHRSTEFGDSVTFMPRIFVGLSQHPVLAQIEQAISTARIRARSRSAPQ